MLRNNFKRLKNSLNTSILVNTSTELTNSDKKFKNAKKR